MAALGFMFSGKLMLHLLGGGHYFLVPLAWLPLVLLALEPAVRRGSVVLATAAGAAFALVVLAAHPQLTFYCGVFVAVWTVGPTLESAGYLGGTGPRSRRRTAAALARWLGCGAWTVVVAVALSAVELWPAVEATHEATRGMGVGVDETWAGALGLMLLRLIGPSQTGWELRGGIGALWLGTAALAPLLRRGLVRYQAGVCLALVVFALGGGGLFQGLPGFNLFQYPSRMLLPASFPLALLAGTAVDALLAAPRLPAEALRRCRRALIVAVVFALLLAAGGALLDFPGFASRGVPAPLLAWWVLAPAAAAVLAWLVGRPGRPAALAWAALLLAELWLVALPLVDVRSQAEVYAPSACVRYVAEGGGRVLDRGLPDHAASTPLTPGLAIVEGVEPLRGYNSLDVRRYKEYLQLVTDSDRPLRARGAVRVSHPANLSDRQQVLAGPAGHALPAPARRPSRGGAGMAARLRGRGADGLSGHRRRPAAPCRPTRSTSTKRPSRVPSSSPTPSRCRPIGRCWRPCAAKLRRMVFLEGWAGSDSRPPADSPREARVIDYRPNRVRVGVGPGAAGYLVLADVWYPGWTCTVDGRPAPLYRADYLFRAVELPEGAREVVFTFAPASYRLGRLVSAAALATALALLLAGAVRKKPLAGWRSRNPDRGGTVSRPSVRGGCATEKRTVRATVRQALLLLPSHWA